MRRLDAVLLDRSGNVVHETTVPEDHVPQMMHTKKPVILDVHRIMRDWSDAQFCKACGIAPPALDTHIAPAKPRLFALNDKKGDCMVYREV